MNDHPQRFRDLPLDVQEAIRAKTRALIPACTELLDALAPKLDEASLKFQRSLLRAGEWGLMLDSLCATLVVEPSIPVTRAERELLLRALTIIGDDPGGRLTYLQDRQGTLDAVTMVDDEGRVVAPVRPRLPVGAPLRAGSKGGHLQGVGFPFKTTFPASWDVERIEAEVLDVARNPDVVPLRDRNGGWLTRGVRDGVEIEVRLRQQGSIVIGYPVGGVGVYRTDATGVPQSVEA